MPEFWLRQDMRFSIIFDADRTGGTMASWESEVSPSNRPPAQVVTFPADRHIRCLAGRGLVETEAGVLELNPGGSLFIPGGMRVVMRNALRDPWRFETVMTPAGAEGFLESLSFGLDDETLQQEAAAYGLELHLPEPEPEPPAVLVAAAHRIPEQWGFSL